MSNNNTMTKSLSLIGYACGIGAGDSGCGSGPVQLHQANHWLAELAQHKLAAHWSAMLYPPVQWQTLGKLAALASINSDLARYTQQAVQQQQFFSVLAGDHSSAIGTWSGVAAAIRPVGDLGLIWIDAHLDSNTFETSPSMNIHGMPLACLLGYGAQELIQIGDKLAKLKPEQVCVIGARSYEAGEHALLQRLGVRIFYMPEIQQRGLAEVLLEAKQIVTRNTAGYGITLDLDGLDPSDAPAVGTPEPNGILAKDLLQHIALILPDQAPAVPLLGLEITEFNPYHDQACKTQQLLTQLLKEIAVRVLS